MITYKFEDLQLNGVFISGQVEVWAVCPNSQSTPPWDLAESEFEIDWSTLVFTELHSDFGSYTVNADGTVMVAVQAYGYDKFKKEIEQMAYYYIETNILWEEKWVK